MRALVAEERALDSRLSVCAVSRDTPNEAGISCIGAQDDVLAGTDNLCRPWAFVSAGIVPSK